MNKKNQAILTLSFYTATSLGGAAFMWGLFNYMEQVQEKNPINYEAFKVTAIKEETDKAVRFELKEKMDACLRDARNRNIAEPFQCVAEIQVDQKKIAEIAQSRVESTKALDQRYTEHWPKIKWGLPAFFLLAMGLALHRPVREQIAAIKGPAATTSPS